MKVLKDALRGELKNMRKNQQIKCWVCKKLRKRRKLREFRSYIVVMSETEFEEK